MSYRITGALVDRLVTTDQARADYEATPADLRTDLPGGAFTLYTRGELGHRLAPVTYTPQGESECASDPDT